jgi:hypothetical protein
VTSARSIRTFLVLLVLGASAVAALSFAGSASASADTKCGRQVLNDWYDNGRIDRLYPLNCYEEAIDQIPSDIGPYVDAEDVITRALQGALSNHLVDGSTCDPSADGSNDDCNGSNGGKGPGQDPGNNGQNPGDDGSTQAQDSPSVNTSSSSSVPIPLLVLGGMSILLLAAGGLGYVSRRRQAVHADDTDDSGNPPV